MSAVATSRRSNASMMMERNRASLEMVGDPVSSGEYLLRCLLPSAQVHPLREPSRFSFITLNARSDSDFCSSVSVKASRSSKTSNVLNCMNSFLRASMADCPS